MLLGISDLSILKVTYYPKIVRCVNTHYGERGGGEEVAQVKKQNSMTKNN